MDWKEELKIEKGMGEKILTLVKTIKENSFKRKLKKFLLDNLDVKYEEDTHYSQRRVSTKSESLEEAKNILLDKVEEIFDEIFPETKYNSPVDDPNYIPLDAP